MIPRNSPLNPCGNIGEVDALPAGRPTCRPMINIEDWSGQAGSTILGSSIESISNYMLLKSSQDYQYYSIALTTSNYQKVWLILPTSSSLPKNRIEIVYQGMNFQIEYNRSVSNNYSSSVSVFFLLVDQKPTLKIFTISKMAVSQHRGPFIGCCITNPKTFSINST